MKILIIGAGKMGSFFCDLLSFDHEVAVYDADPKRLRFTYNCQRFDSLDSIDDFAPELVINAVTLAHTIEAFDAVIPHLPERCIICDIASVKTGLPEYYVRVGRPFVSTHPMFGPTFASLANLTDENAVVIAEGDALGKAFFRDLYSRLNLHVVEYTFEQHDLATAYSLSSPFAATLMFGSIIERQDAPGTTFKRHMAIAQGLMSEDDTLISEILFNPNTPARLRLMADRLSELQRIVERRDSSAMRKFLARVRKNLE